MTTSKSLWVVAPVICLSAFTSVVAAKPARFTTIDNPGAIDALAYVINPAGDIVCGSCHTLGNKQAFALRNGNFTPFDWPGPSWTGGWGINPQADSVGQYGWFENGFNTVHEEKI